MTDESSDPWPINGIGQSISLVPVDHDPFNDAWANGSPIDPSGVLPSSTEGVGRSISLVPVDHDPFNDPWANGSPIAPSGTLPLPTGGVGRSISLIPVDHDPFNESWAIDPFNGSSANRSPVDPSDMFASYMSGQSMAPLQSQFGVGNLPSSVPSGGAPGLSEAPPAPTLPSRSVLFNPSAELLEPRAADPDAASRDQIDPRLAELAKTGVPFAPPAPNPELYLAGLVVPNIVDYFTKPTPPPQWVFPSVPGKIRSNDNPYAGRALLDVASFLGPGPVAKAITLPGLPLLRAFARIAEEAAPGAAAKILEATGVGPLATQIDRATLLHLSAELGQLGDEELTRIGQEVAGGNPQVIVGRYKDLSGKLPPGIQADHFNQQAVYGRDPGNGQFIPRGEGLSVAVSGNVLREPDRSHSLGHQYLEFSWWDQFREGGSRFQDSPTNAEYGVAKRRSLIVGGISRAQASDIAVRAAAERVSRGFGETDRVPRIPGPIFRLRR